MKYIDVSLSIWKWEGRILIGGSPSDAKKHAKAFADAEANIGEHAAGHAFVEYGKPWLLWLASLDDIPALSHEAFHITSGVLEARGLRLTDASEEAYTYTMEAIVRAAVTAKGWRKTR